MWHTRLETLDGTKRYRVHLLQDDVPMTFASVLGGWRHDAGFAGFFSGWLAELPFEACFWEMPALTNASVTGDFECVVIDSPALAGVTADRRAFDGYFDAPDGLVAGFDNLGGDAFLIAPYPTGDYPHLLAFVRNAPPDQQFVLWKTLGDALAERLSDRPLWVSTSGLGIYWLHIRLDSHPKYYNFRPYT